MTVVWLTNVPIAFVSIIRFLKNREAFVGKDLLRIRNDPMIIFQITTRSATRTPVVERGINSIIKSCHKIEYVDYQIYVVTDDPNDLNSLHHLDCKVLLVDRNFRTNAIKKGRALQYAVEHRRKTEQDHSEQWVFHMDDESYVTPQTVLSLLKAIREIPGLAFEGPIFYPLKFESANILTALAESIRPFTCYDCVSQMKNQQYVKTSPLHMHGSNLLVRSDVENSIGWNFGPTLAEDQMFGYQVYHKYGPTSIGWHGGILLEQPPLNMKDHFMQRRRWVLGSLQNIDKFPAVHKFKLFYKLLTYFMGFASGFVSTMLSFHVYLPLVLVMSYTLLNYRVGDDSIAVVGNLLRTLYSESTAHFFGNMGPFQFGIGSILLFSSVVWLLSYQVGLFLNLRYSKIAWSKRFVLHVQTLVLCPILGLVETFPAFWTLIEYYAKGRTLKSGKNLVYDFYVIDK
jgi:cellulose synthase/poly-beta-1,6-N-acetylglucosamine synthase-like glycosyltransferase